MIYAWDNINREAIRDITSQDVIVTFLALGGILAVMLIFYFIYSIINKLK